MTRAGALNFRPIGMEGDLVPRLHALLERCPAEIVPGDRSRMAERDVDSLRDFLLYPAPKRLTEEDDVTDEQLEACTYKAAQILCMPPRVTADWWLFLKEVDDRLPCGQKSQKRPNDRWGTPEDKRKKWKEVIDLLGRHCLSMIDEDPTLTPDNRRRFRDGLRHPASGAWELSFAVSSMPETGLGSLLPVSDPDAHYPFTRRIFLRDSHGWRLQPAESHWRLPTTVEFEQLDEEIRRRFEASFSPPTTWGLVLLFDLLRRGPDWQRVGGTFWILQPLELWGVSEWRITPADRVAVVWPAPGFFSFWGYDIFLSHWNAALRHLRKSDMVERYVYAWLDAGAAVLLRDKPLWSPETQGTPDWDALINRLAEPAPQPETAPRAGSARKVRSVSQLAAQDNPRGYGAAQWLTRLACFAVARGQRYTKGDRRSLFQGARPSHILAEETLRDRPVRRRHPDALERKRTRSDKC